MLSLTRLTIRRAREERLPQIAGSLTFGLANLADYLWPLWDEENRALHDFIVDTRSIKT